MTQKTSEKQEIAIGGALPETLPVEGKKKDLRGLLDAIRDPKTDSKVQDEKLIELRNIGADREDDGHAEATKELLNMVRDGRQSTHLKTGIMHHLAYIVWNGPDETSSMAMNGLIEFMNDGEHGTSVRKSAMRWLSETTRPAAAAELTKFAKNRDNALNLRDEAVTGLGYIGRWGNRADGMKATRALVGIIKAPGENPKLVETAIMDLGRIGYHGEDETVSLAAVDGLREFYAESKNEGLRSLAKDRLEIETIEEKTKARRTPLRKIRID